MSGQESGEAHVIAGLMLRGLTLASRTPLARVMVRGVERVPAGDLDAVDLPVDYAGLPAAEEIWAGDDDGRTVRNVTRPTLTAVLPDPATATGAAAIVAPGGGHLMLAYDKEGLDVARWLADRGVAAFVLKYRLEPTPPEDHLFLRGLLGILDKAARYPERPFPRQPLAVADARAALRYVREQAPSLGIDPHRVGMIGYSAGAMLTLATAIEDPQEALERPDFLGYVYGPMRPVDVPAHLAPLPPLFCAIAGDDVLFRVPDPSLADSWRDAGGQAGLHVYRKGGHGYGLGGPRMRDDLEAWIAKR